MSIEVTYVPNEWRALWLFPEYHGIFRAIQVWSWITPKEAENYGA